MDALPIDPLLPEIVARLREAGTLVLEAPPGAGKTTRVPRALLDAGATGEREVLVLEPRRLAARLAARRVADELGERVGERVGYQVRFEDVSSAATRVRFVTEGVLTRRLLADPTLSRVGAVLLDEFHERHLQGDVGLALLRKLRRERRPDLLLGVMSATLDAGPVREYLGGPSVRSEGRRFDVAIEYLTNPDIRPLHVQVAAAVRRLAPLDGHVLVFLPGAGEIRRALEACEPFAREHGYELVALHGELPPEQQDRAVRAGGPPRIVLSTNVAETSVTIAGVSGVIDSGLARVAGHAAWSGLSTLRLQRVSKASATQRAGRAGRTRAGRCLRLYTLHDFETRAPHEEPEVRRLDLAQTVLELRATGVDPFALEWLEAPPKAALDAADELLTRLGALDAARALTQTGRRLLRFAVHPRLARLVVEAESRGAGGEGAALAALLGERDVERRESFEERRGPRQAKVSAHADAVERLEAFLEAKDHGFAAGRVRDLGLDAGAVRAVERVRQQLARVAERSRALKPAELDVALRMSLLAAFPDRVARLRERPTERAPGGGGRGPAQSIASGRALQLASGGAATLAESSVVQDAALLVAVDAEERRADGAGRGGGVIVRSAAAIEEDWLLDLFPDALVEEKALAWNASLERVDASLRLRYDALTLDERPDPSPDPAAVAKLLAAEARATGAARLLERVAPLLARAAFVAEAFPDGGVASPGPLADALDRALVALCEGRRSFADLRDATPDEAVAALLGPDALRALARLAPDSVTLPHGRRLAVHYDAGGPPWVESRLQDFFGAARGPALGGRVPLVLHLLAPNHRAVQVTTDLAGFWSRHYPAIRKELMRKYPRHAWPEDPAHAAPPAPGRR